jgi:phosphomannomutase
MDVSGKVVMITGASSGIGRELAHVLLARGSRLALLARSVKAVEDLAAELSLAGAEAPAALRSGSPQAALAAPADVTDRAAVDKAVAAALAHFGRIDVLVNCAGLGYFGPIETMSIEDFDRVVRTNLFGVINCTQSALPALRQSRGIIVNVSSGLAMRALPFLSAYAGTKSMLNALSDGLRLELAPDGIRVLTYCPPATDTDFDKKALKGPGMEKVSLEGRSSEKVGKVAHGIAEAIRTEKRRTGGGFFKVMNALAPKALDRMFSGMAARIGKEAGNTGEITLGKSLSYQPVELSFGTSGLRGLVRDITNLEAYIGAKGFLSFLLGRGEIRRGDTVYFAGDLRPSTDGPAPEEGGRGEILQAVCRGIEGVGLTPAYLGKIPSPALMLYALRRGAASVMVTGSHIPFDRNGIKLNRPSGEILKSDEAGILSSMEKIRTEEYEKKARESLFDTRGMVKREHRKPLPPPSEAAREEYVRRYTSAFPVGRLTGKKILVWQHSAVGRDILVEIFKELGANVIPAERSDTFVPVDTEAVNEVMIARLQALVDASGGASLHAVVSTDGDGDRPLLLGVEGGQLRFFPGDLLGLLTADFLGARHIAVPISVNDAVDIHFAGTGVTLVKTRIGSPHVISAMKEAGWEANGGFLMSAPLSVPGGGRLDPLPTRDAMLPLLSVLYAAERRGGGISDLFKALPPRFGRSALLREFPRERSLLIIGMLSPREPGAEEVKFGEGRPEVKRTGSAAAEMDRFIKLRDLAAKYFTPADGFSEVTGMNWLDGVRIMFSNGDVAHIRPSGNAPELRLYAVADAQERADRISALGISDGGILRRMERDAVEEGAIAGLLDRPRPILLRGAVQHYPWGGFDFIPTLIGEKNGGRRPYAELWIGAHPRAPSTAEILFAGAAASIPLDRLVSAAAGPVLGESAARRFDGKLPYLLKILDARSMLSIQAHPSKSQAEAGFARENAAGVPLTAPERNYPDDNHKPEVHVALTDFRLLHGFRPLEEIASIIAGTRSDSSGRLPSAPEIGRVMPEFGARLQGAGADPRARRELIRELYGRMMTLDQPHVDDILGPLIERLERAGNLDRDSPDFWAIEAARSFPLRGGGLDRGIFSLYILNLVRLMPGQGTFQPTGTLHAYLEGANVELMASSDNVLRGGLTSKHVDVTELLATLTFESGKPPILEGRMVSGTERAYPVPADDFSLSMIEPRPGNPHAAGEDHGAECLLVTDGEVTVESEGTALSLPRGGIGFMPAGLAYTVEARGPRAVLIRAGIPTGSGA